MADKLDSTPLYEAHISLGARMAPFAGWEMPVQYTSILQEAKAVRTHAGVFDVSHMGRIHLEGVQATELLDWVVTNGVASLKVGRGRYTCLCNEEGGIIDDAIYYRRGESEYLLVCNASNKRQVVSWLRHWIQDRYTDAVLEDRSAGTAMIALQGSGAAALLDDVGSEGFAGLRTFNWSDATIRGVSAFAARTGYTGEDGFEIVLPGDDSPQLWHAFIDKGATPCGLGARDVLRQEASFPLHGNDIDATTTPIEAGLDRFVRPDKEFAGANVLRKQMEGGVTRRLVGLRINGRGIARKGYPIMAGRQKVGEVTSGTHSPTLDRSIAMGYVSTKFTEPGQTLAVNIRDRMVEAEVARLPFYSSKR